MGLLRVHAARETLAGESLPGAVERLSVAVQLRLVVCAILLSGCAGASSDGPARVEVGLPAPQYRAESLDGDSVSLADRRDRVVLLNVWATWCHPCRTEIP